MNDAYKEVYFGEFCKSCTHFNLREEDRPCDECLANPVNLYSHKPVKWERKSSRN